MDNQIHSVWFHVGSRSSKSFTIEINAKIYTTSIYHFFLQISQRIFTCFFSLTLFLKRLWDIMQPLSFENKQFRIKEECQRLLIRTLNEYVFVQKQMNILKRTDRGRKRSYCSSFLI